MTTFCKNLKRFRLSKNLTQEQAAEALGVSTQSISRWECGTTLPDVTMLPHIAQLYCVTIDDLYKETSAAYDNYAQRLGSIYRSTWEPMDFARADQEFRKIYRNGTASMEDIRLYGILHQFMMGYCMKKAETLFSEVIEKCDIPDVYWRTRRQKLYLLAQIGRGKEGIMEQCRILEKDSGNLNEWVCLIAACQYAGDYGQAYEWFQKATGRFPAEAILYVYGGDICEKRGDLEEAFRHWDRALQLDHNFCDAKHSKAFCYEKTGQFDKAYELWCEIADALAKDGFDVEAGINRERARKCKERI